MVADQPTDPKEPTRCSFKSAMGTNSRKTPRENLPPHSWARKAARRLAEAACRLREGTQWSLIQSPRKLTRPVS